MLGRDLDKETDNCSTMVCTPVVRSESTSTQGKHLLQAWNKALTFQNTFTHSKELVKFRDEKVALYCVPPAIQ